MNALHNLPQEPCSILETAAVGFRPSVCAQEFVPQIAVAVLDVYEVEAKFGGGCGGAMEVFDDAVDFAIAQNWIVGPDTQPLVQNRVTVKNLRLVAVPGVRLAVASGVSQLQPDDWVG